MIARTGAEDAFKHHQCPVARTEKLVFHVNTGVARIYPAGGHTPSPYDRQQVVNFSFFCLTTRIHCAGELIGCNADGSEARLRKSSSTSPFPNSPILLEAR